MKRSAPDVRARASKRTRGDGGGAAGDAEARLRETDAALDPRTDAALAEYLNAGAGRPEDAARLLGGSFVGLPRLVNLMEGWTAALGAEPQGVEPLLALVEARFGPRSAVGVFDGAAPPPWLAHAVSGADKRWTELVRRLLERHPGSLVAQYAAQRLLAGGFGGGELARAAIAAGLPLDGFAAVLEAELRDAAAAAARGEAVSDGVGRIVGLCCQSEQAHLAAQLALARLGARPPFVRVSEDLADAVRAAHPRARADHAVLLLAGAARHPDALEALAAVSRTGAVQPVDATRLHAAYTAEPADARPPAALLARAPVARALMRALFEPGRAPPQEFAARYAHLLAVAASGAAGGADAEIGDVAKAVGEATAVCRARDFAATFAERGAATLRRHLRHAPAAAGAVHWARCVLTGTALYATAHHSACVPALLAVLAEAASRHAQLLPRVLAAASEAVRGSPNLGDSARLRLHRQLLLLYVHLVHCGHVAPVFDDFTALVPRIDRSLVRSFVGACVGTAEPPYSDEFVGRVAALLALPDVRAALLAARDLSFATSVTGGPRGSGSTAPRVRQFAKHALGAEHLALGKEQRAVLSSLARL